MQSSATWASFAPSREQDAEIASADWVLWDRCWTVAADGWQPGSLDAVDAAGR
jgi:hypothetical protein